MTVIEYEANSLFERSSFWQKVFLGQKYFFPKLKYLAKLLEENNNTFLVRTEAVFAKPKSKKYF